MTIKEIIQIQIDGTQSDIKDHADNITQHQEYIDAENIVLNDLKSQLQDLQTQFNLV